MSIKNAIVSQILNESKINIHKKHIRLFEIEIVCAEKLK